MQQKMPQKWVYDTAMHPSIMGRIENFVVSNMHTYLATVMTSSRIPQWWYFLCNVIIHSSNTTVHTTR